MQICAIMCRYVQICANACPFFHVLGPSLSLSLSVIHNCTHTPKIAHIICVVPTVHHPCQHVAPPWPPWPHQSAFRTLRHLWCLQWRSVAADPPGHPLPHLQPEKQTPWKTGRTVAVMFWRGFRTCYNPNYLWISMDIYGYVWYIYHNPAGLF